MDSVFLVLGSGLGAVAVALGAFGAHGLRRRWTDERVTRFEIGVRYQLYHALAIIATAYVLDRWPGSAFGNLAGWSFIAGILIFSGSLYLLVISGRRWLEAVTPVGGLALLVGWVSLALAPIFS